MSALTQAVETAIKKIAGNIQIRQIIIGVAKNVRETTCDLERINAPTLLDCRLNAIDDNLQNFVTIYPKENSNIIVGIIENDKTDAVVLQCSEVEKVKLKIGEQTLLIDKEGFIFNNGQNYGLVKVKELTQKLNNVENKLNTILSTLQGVSITLAPSGTFAFAPIFSNIQPLQTTQQLSIENTKIKQ